MSDADAIARRLAAAYCTYYATVGLEYVYMPFFFTRIGLTPGEVGIVYAGRIATMIICQPLTTHFAERSGRPYFVLKCGMALGFVCASGLIVAHSLALAAVFMWTQAAMRSVAIPILDSTTLRERGPERYGKTRLWGSIGYLLAALGFASAVGDLAYDQAGTLVLPAYLSVNAVMVIVMLWLPSDMHLSAHTDNKERLVNKAVAALMVFGALHWAAVETYNVYFSLTVRERGFSPAVPGFGFTAAIVCEVTIFFVFAWFLKRAPARLWVLVSIAVSIARWIATAYASTPVTMVLIQGAHAFSFALWWASMLKVLGEIAPGGRRGALQGIFTAAIMGCGGALGTSISGRIIGHYGGRTMFLGAAVLEVFALILAVATLRFWWRAEEPAAVRG